MTSLAGCTGQVHQGPPGCHFRQHVGCLEGTKMPCVSCVQQFCLWSLCVASSQPSQSEHGTRSPTHRKLLTSLWARAYNVCVSLAQVRCSWSTVTSSSLPSSAGQCDTYISLNLQSRTLRSIIPASLVPKKPQDKGAQHWCWLTWVCWPGMARCCCSLWLQSMQSWISAHLTLQLAG